MDGFRPFWNLLGPKMNILFHCPLRNFITVILSHQRGLYDLRCGWDTILFDFWSFCTVFGRFSTVLEFFRYENENFFPSLDAKNYYEFFKPSTRSLRLKMRMGHNIFRFLVILDRFWTIFDRFGIFLVRK